MQLSDQIKELYSIRQALSDYGISIPPMKGKGIKIHCPFPGHSDNNASFTIWAEGENFSCFSCSVCPEGSVIDFIAGMEGISEKEAIKRLAAKVLTNDVKPKKSDFDWETSKKIREHFYQDELGIEIIRKVIYRDATGEKTAIPYLIDGTDRAKGTKGLNGLKYPVYQLPLIIKSIADNKTIYLTEGEKDAESLCKLGIPSATVGGATSRWLSQHLAIFPKGHEIVILVDNDEAGKKYGNDTASTFVKHGCIVKLINLADHEPKMGNKADVTDWLEIGHNADQLLELVANTEIWELTNVYDINTKKQKPKPEPEPEQVLNDWRDNYKELSDYKIKSNGLYRCYEKTKSNGDVVPMEVQLSNFVARIAKNITKDDGQEQTTAFEIDGFLANGKPLPLITIDTADFEGMKWVIDKWRGDAIIAPVPNVREYLRHSTQEVSKFTKTNQTIYNYTGWRKINDKWAYLHAGGAIGADDVTVDLTGEGNLSRYILPAVNKDLAKESALMALKILAVADLKITVPLLSLIYLSPLCEPLHQADKEPDFVMWVQAKTQSLKSSFAAVLLSHFGKGFNKNTLTASFKGTANSIEKIGYTLKDTLTVADDFHPSSSKFEAVKMTQTAQMIMRAWGDRTGRSRCNVDGTLRKTYPPRGMCLVTGEDIPDVGESGLGRLFLVPINQGDINGGKLSELQDQDSLNLLAQNMTNYIDWVAPQIESIAKNANKGLREIRDSITEKYDLKGRSPETLAFLRFGFNMFLSYCESVGALHADQRDELFKKGQNALVELSCSYAEKIAEEKPKEKFFTALRELIISQRVDLLPIEESPKIGSVSFIGWSDLAHECYCLIPETTYTQIVKFYNEQGVNFPVSKNRLWQDLADDGHLLVSTKRLDKQKRINGKLTWVICLKINALYPDK